MQCDRGLDFQPRTEWPAILPALSWRGFLVTDFDRGGGGGGRGGSLEALDLGDAHFVEVMKSAYPDLALGELARLTRALSAVLPESYAEFRDPLLAAYGLRWSERLEETFALLVQTPFEFQTWVDDKKLGARDLAALLALPQLAPFLPFLTAIVRLPISKSDGVRALELGVELFLMGRELTDLLPSGDHPGLYLRQLEKWRRPLSSGQDEAWRRTVAEWPWPSRVEAAWQRFGDETGLEIKIRATSPQDFSKQLERLASIRETWGTCKS